MSKPIKLTKSIHQKVMAQRVLFREGLYVALLKDLLAEKPGAEERAYLIINNHTRDLRRINRWLKSKTVKIELL